MKIYTRKGDQGTTSLIGGERVPKDHPCVRAYGAVDELMAHTAYLRDNVPQEGFGRERDSLLRILNDLMAVSAVLACGEGSTDAVKPVTEGQVEFLEGEIDRIYSRLPAIDKFTLPGGHPLVSLSHIARTVCRRAERESIPVRPDSQPHGMARRYLNRLSDYFYALGRKFSSDFNIKELLWTPDK